MAFGQPVSELTRDSVGTEGYIVKVDTSTVLAYTIEQVQAQVSGSDTPSPVTAEENIDVLYAYLNDSGCPDLAFSESESECSIFLKTSVFPYVSGTRVALFGKRISQDAVLDADLLDVPDKDIDLVKAYALKEAYTTIKGGYVPKSVNDTIKVEERRVRGEV